MAVFTVFFCGTGSNSYDATHKNYHRGELISTLARNHLGSEFVDWIIVDGPGSGNLQEGEKWVEPGNYANWRGTLFGTGWKENVEHAIAMIDGSHPEYSNVFSKTQKKNLAKYGVDPQIAQNPGARISPQELQAGLLRLRAPATEESRRRPLDYINVIGWSRGAITCHMFANRLRQHPTLGHLGVRIFACDPVPGYGMTTPPKSILDISGTRVTEYVGIYSEDERSRSFSPVLPNLPPACIPYITTIPGRHATLVGNSAIDGGSGPGVDGINGLTGPGQITRHLAEVYLSNWGTNLGSRLHLSDDMSLRIYDEMIGQQAFFAAMHKESYTKFTQSGSRSVFMGNGKCVNFNSAYRLQKPTGFVNLHHHDVFRRVYPEVCDLVTTDQFWSHPRRDEMLVKVDVALSRTLPHLCKRWRQSGLLPKR